MLLCHQIPPYSPHIISSLPNQKFSLPTTAQARTTVKTFQMPNKVVIFNQANKVSRHNCFLFLLGGRKKKIVNFFYLEGTI